jgi:hypothetical protein
MSFYFISVICHLIIGVNKRMYYDVMSCHVIATSSRNPLDNKWVQKTNIGKTSIIIIFRLHSIISVQLILAYKRKKSPFLYSIRSIDHSLYSKYVLLLNRSRFFDYFIIYILFIWCAIDHLIFPIKEKNNDAKLLSFS